MEIPVIELPHESAVSPQRLRQQHELMLGTLREIREAIRGASFQPRPALTRINALTQRAIETVEDGHPC